MSNLNLFFNSKNGQSYPIVKMVAIVIMVFVIILVIFQFSGLKDTPEGGISDFKLKSIIERCEISSKDCNIELCTEESGCVDEIKMASWVSFVAYKKRCDDIVDDEEKDKLNCGGVLYDKIVEQEETEKKSNLGKSDQATGIGGVEISDDGTVVVPEDYLNIINKFKSSDFYRDNQIQFETYAMNKNINPNMIYAIIIKEGGYLGTFENSVRFECHKYNKKNKGFDDAKCTLKDGKSFSTISSETNYDAFLAAYKNNPGAAFESTSYGFAQVLGENILRYESTKDYDLLLDKIKTTEYQINIFFNFLEENGIISDMRSKSYSNIAKKYNGANYAQNEYDIDLEGYYEGLYVLSKEKIIS